MTFLVSKVFFETYLTYFHSVNGVACQMRQITYSDWSEVMQQKLVTESGEIWDYATKIVDILLKGWHCLEEYCTFEKKFYYNLDYCSFSKIKSECW